VKVAVLMGSDSDWETVQEAVRALGEFGVETDVHVLSAHRTPDRLAGYVREAERAGAQVFIAAAGGAAHLAGAVAAQSTRPVIGIPIETPALGGLDSLLSTVQMPGGVPVATVAIGKGGAKNAGLLAVQILALADAKLAAKLSEFKKTTAEAVLRKNEELQKRIKNLS
jgi:phosphoribosylaminoimidazole carboxylase PurE protein